MARKSKSGRGARTNAAGRELLASLYELRDAIVSGDTSKLTIHTVEISDPNDYSAKKVKALRQSLGVSQRVFAHLLAVSPQLVAHWEYGIRKPSPMACRLLDRIKENPDAYLASLVRRKSA